MAPRPTRPPPTCPTECRGRLNELDRLTPPRLGRSTLAHAPATPGRLFEREVMISQVLPRDAMLACLSFLDVTAHTGLATICRDWLELSEEDALWRDHYLNRFTGGEGDGDGDISEDEVEAVSPKTHTRTSCKRAYKARLEDPRVGDDVEVAWRGKFRLERLEIYRGTAWWVAVVVDKVALGSGDSPGRGRKVHAAKAWYKVTFPGWEGRWDEWVSHERLRWRAKGPQLTRITRGDAVEVWCGSQNVPGAWLEASIKRIRGDDVKVERVLSSGSLWVARGRVRRARSSIAPRVSHTGFLARGWRVLAYPFRALKRRVL